MYYVEETVDYGVTPATPVLTTIRHTGTTLGLSKNTTVSEELRPDRQISNYRHGTKQIGGDINTELSSGSFDDLIEAVMLGTWATDVLKAGTVRRSFSIYRNFSDFEAGDGAWNEFQGVEFNTWNVSLQPDGIVQSNFGVVGQRQNAGTDTEPAGSTFPPPNVNDPFDSFSGILKEGGVDLGIVTEINFTLENGIEPRFVVGSDETIRPMISRSNLSGEMTVYFENSELMNKFIDETHSSLEFSVVKGSQSYTFLMPNVVYNGGQPDTQGQGAITLTMPFQALYDVTEATQLKITRTT